MIDEILKSKARNLLKEYEAVLMHVIEVEETKINGDKKVGNSSFEIVKKSLFNAGTKEGLRRFLACINRIADHGDR